MSAHRAAMLLRYLDGEMKPDERSMVEKQLQADPLLCEHLEFIEELRRAARERSGSA